jgi:hypothetical protein
MVKRNRRQFLAESLGAGLVLSPAAKAWVQEWPTAEVRVCLVAVDAHRRWDIGGIFQELGLKYEITSPDVASRIETNRFAALWIASSTYPELGALPEELTKKLEEFLEAGKGVFAEYVSDFPGVRAGDSPQKTGIARLFVAHPLDLPGALAAGAILDEQDSLCLPLVEEPKGTKPVLAFGRVAGVERIVPEFQPKDTWTGLLWGERAGGRYALATTSLSEFRRRQYAPLAHWSKFLRELVIALLPEPQRRQVLERYIPVRAYTEPRVWALPGAIVRVVVETAPKVRVELARPAKVDLADSGGGRYEVEQKIAGPGRLDLAVEVSRAGQKRRVEFPLRVADRRTAYSHALERNIRWYERSGALLKPDGTRGVSEWVSGPDIEGVRIAYGAEQQQSPERADCVFESALAFWLYGRLAGSPPHRRMAENMLVRIMDFQRLERGDPGYGLWNTRGRGGPAFQDDTSWATICALAAYRYTKNNMFLERGLLSARAQTQAFGPDDRLRAPAYAKVQQPISLTQQADEHPHSGGCVLSAWLYTYGITGDRSYLELALPMLRKMVEGFSKIPRYIISKTCESARFLLPLALACAYSPDPLFKKALRDQASYLRSRTDGCGAIQEEGSNIGHSVEGGDLGLTYNADEKISDQLYCTSFAAMNYWIAYKATGERAYLEDFVRTADYLVRIQVESPDAMIDGGWMRGFDYSLWEYYGSNADQGWNAYCLETGWTNAIIDIALGLFLTDDSFFEPKHA